MSEWLVFLLPPAIALAGMRLADVLLGAEFRARYGTGLRFGLGLGLGMLVFTQAILAGALAGINLAGFLAKTALIWGAVELALRTYSLTKRRRDFRVGWNHLWLLLLLPLTWHFCIFSQLSVMEGTLEFDAAVHWLMKSKILYLKQGVEFMQLAQNPNLAYVHWDYPALVPALYTLNYGAAGEVNEFVNKVWPFWMIVALTLAILSLGDAWRRPHPLPIFVALIVCFLPGTLRYIHWEGATVPMMFLAGLTALLAVRALTRDDLPGFAAALLMLAACAMTKFEGMLYAAFWLLAILPIGWRRQWLGHRTVWKAAAFAFVCLLPYIVFRLKGPIIHIESGWPRILLQSPEGVGRSLPVVLALGLGHRFFNDLFFNWAEAPGGGMQWAGHWEGWSTLANQQLHVLPWLSLLFLGLAFWCRRGRRAAVLLSLVVLAVCFMLALVITGIAQLYHDSTSMIISTTGEGMGRYYLPFFLAWFLGLVSMWFVEKPSAGRSHPDQAARETVRSSA